MDSQTLAQQLVGSLAPFLPYLLKAGEEAAGEAGKKFGAEAWERAKALWAKLRPQVEAKPAAQEAAQDVAANPQTTRQPSTSSSPRPRRRRGIRCGWRRARSGSSRPHQIMSHPNKKKSPPLTRR